MWKRRGLVFVLLILTMAAIGIKQGQAEEGRLLSLEKRIEQLRELTEEIPGRIKKLQEQLSRIADIEEEKEDIDRIMEELLEMARNLEKSKSIQEELLTLHEEHIITKEIFNRLNSEIKEITLSFMNFPEPKEYTLADARKRLSELMEEIEEKRRFLRERYLKKADFVIEEKQGRYFIRDKQGKFIVSNVRDARKTIQHAIDRAPDGGIVFVKKGVYPIDSGVPHYRGILINKRKGLRLLSDGAVLRCVKRDGIEVVDSEGIEIAGFWIYQDSRGLPLDYKTGIIGRKDARVVETGGGRGICLVRTKDCHLHHNIIGRQDRKGCFTQGIYLPGGPQYNVTIESNVVLGSSFSGIGIAPGKGESFGHKIINNYVAYAGAMGVNPDGNQGNLLIKGNWFVKNGWTAAKELRGFAYETDDSHGIGVFVTGPYTLILENVCLGNKLHGIHLKTHEKGIISGNYSDKDLVVCGKEIFILGNRIRGFTSLAASKTVMINNVCEGLRVNGDDVWIAGNLFSGGEKCYIGPWKIYWYGGQHAKNIDFLFNKVTGMKEYGLMITPSTVLHPLGQGFAGQGKVEDILILNNAFLENEQREEELVRIEVAVLGEFWETGRQRVPGGIPRNIDIQGNIFRTRSDVMVSAVVVAFSDAVSILGNFFDSVTGYRVAVEWSKDKEVKVRLPSGLIAYLPFNEGKGDTVKDISGYGHHGEIRGSQIRIKKGLWVKQGISNNYALKLKGENFILCKADLMPISDGITISAWLKPEERKGLSGIFRPDAFGMLVGESFVGAIKMPEAEEADKNGWVRVEADFPIGIFSHYAFTYSSGDKTLRLYRNGTLVASKTITIAGGDGKIPIPPYYCPLFIGVAWLAGPHWGYHYGPWRYYKGIIDEVRIYNKVLTGEEIKNYYEQTKNMYSSDGEWKEVKE